MRTRMRTHAHTRTHARTHTHTRARAHTHAHARTHAHIYIERERERERARTRARERENAPREGAVRWGWGTWEAYCAGVCTYACMLGDNGQGAGSKGTSYCAGRMPWLVRVVISAWPAPHTLFRQHVSGTHHHHYDAVAKFQGDLESSYYDSRRILLCFVLITVVCGLQIPNPQTKGRVRLIAQSWM